MRIRMYTDGACSGNPGPGGWAVILFLKNKVIELVGNEEETTNNRMEILAAIRGLQYLREIGSKSKVEIYSDSAYLVNAVKNNWIKKWRENGWYTAKDQQVKNRDLWIELIKVMGKDIEINFIKVKGHAGNINNERADKLACSEKAKLMENLELLAR